MTDVKVTLGPPPPPTELDIRLKTDIRQVGITICRSTHSDTLAKMISTRVSWHKTCSR